MPYPEKYLAHQRFKLRFVQALVEGTPEEVSEMIDESFELGYDIQRFGGLPPFDIVYRSENPHKIPILEMLLQVDATNLRNFDDFDLERGDKKSQELVMEARRQILQGQEPETQEFWWKFWKVSGEYRRMKFDGSYDFSDFFIEGVNFDL